jgi:restriction system protein
MECTEQAVDRTEELNGRVDALKGLLEHTLAVDDTIAFDDLRIKEEFPPFAPSVELANPVPKPRKEDFLSAVKPPGAIARLFPWVKKQHQRKLQIAEAAHETALKRAGEVEVGRQKKLEVARAEHEQAKQAFLLKAQQRNQEVNELEAAYRTGDQDAVLTYNTMVLERSEYPDGFPQEFRLAYVPESKELVIEYELPTPDIVPTIVEARYIKARDAFEEKSRKPAEIKEVYQDVVAAVALRTIHEVLEADQGNHIQVVVFNGFVQTIDPATGKDIQPHLISVRTTKESFNAINLARVEKRVCLRNLGAQVSPQPTELLAVRPIVDFNMVDKRFIEGSAIIDNLDGRQNLMDLNPFQFEQLVCDLFAKNGLETKLTRSSRDGGVDAVAFDKRPVLGGKVVIQAKRYRNTVGVSAVRDLYGTMMNEGANKGILVATSGYGPDAFEFAKDKPIELIDGGGLLYLLEQVGVKARIVFPVEG